MTTDEKINEQRETMLPARRARARCCPTEPLGIPQTVCEDLHPPIYEERCLGRCFAPYIKHATIGIWAMRAYMYVVFVQGIEIIDAVCPAFSLSVHSGPSSRDGSLFAVSKRKASNTLEDLILFWSLQSSR